MANEIPDLREYIIQQFPFIISYWIKDQTEIVITSFFIKKRKNSILAIRRLSGNW